jgi:hypothetical protein
VTSYPAAAVLGAAARMHKVHTTGSMAVALSRGMRTLAAAAGLTLCATSTANLPAVLILRPAPDPRFERLEQFFRHYSCPVPRHIVEYLRAADGYGLDYRLMPALAIRETHCGLGEAQNNHWGYHPGRQTFPSIEAGIDYVARQLAQNPTYKGKGLHEKLFTYNPRLAYPEEVKRIMRQIEWK